jgi:hypothetical protein
MAESAKFGYFYFGPGAISSSIFLSHTAVASGRHSAIPSSIRGHTNSIRLPDTIRTSETVKL